MKDVERILRVDHAGECGAIRIYKTQLAVSRLFYKDIVPTLTDMLEHEIKHFEIFDTLLKKRSIRHCYALGLWRLGGSILGFLTALLGRNAIWVCTNSIESTVLHHLDWQLEYLKENDNEVYEAVLSIKAEEEEHKKIGEKNGADSLFYQPVFWVVKKSTEFAIWLSTKL